MALDGDCELGIRDVEYKASDLQDIQRREDEVQTAITLLEANVETLCSLRSFYQLLNDERHPFHKICGPSTAIFTAQLSDCEADLKLQTSRARALAKTTSSRKTLVVQHLQSQAAEEMIGLARSSQRETVAMRIIAFVTVVYLPATLVAVSI